VKAHRFLALYVVLLHIALAGAGFVLLWPNHQPWLLVLELGLLASLVGGFLLLRALDTPREMVEIAGQWIREGELSHRFRLQGPSDLRRLIELYNQMMARLREERTHQEEQDIFLHKVLTASPSGILTTDHEGRIDTVNPAAATLLDLRVEELEGHRPAEHDARMVRLLAEVPRGESRLLGQHGRRRLRCSHSSFFDRGFERSFFVVDDLTHELWATEKTAYDTLIRTLSHEVNNTLGATNSILHSIRAFGDQLREEDRSDFSSALEVAIERSEHLNDFMRRYAEVVRVPDPTKRPTDLHELLPRIIRLMEPEARRRQVKLDLEVAEGLRPVALDAVQMEQVLINLVGNALESIDRGGRVVIRVDQQAGRTRIAVEDSGPGLSREARENLFVPFFSSKPQGQGVGLTLVRKILSNHGFDFALDSAPGEPTRFVMVLSD